MGFSQAFSITQRLLVAGLIAFSLSLIPFTLTHAQGEPAAGPDQQALFTQAWNAARTGDRETYESLRPQLEGYLLYPYWQYEDYRQRRATVPADDMAEFLDRYQDWAFALALRKAWLVTMGERGQWTGLATYGAESRDTEIRCYYAQALLETGQTELLLPLAQTLWTVGHSQPDACDQVFRWLVAEGGISKTLAWERIRLAMLEGNPRFTLYLARFLPDNDQAWLKRWQDLSTGRYRQLGRIRNWPDTDITRMITAQALKKLAHYDSSAAMAAFDNLDGDFKWGSAIRGDIMREIALMAAVDLEPDGMAFIRRVPADHRNDQLLQWQARLGLALGDWAAVDQAVAEMTPEGADDDRWRYWRARAQIALGEEAIGKEEMMSLAGHATFYGFLAADQLDEPYSICPLEPDVDAEAVASLRRIPAFERALALHESGIDNWAQAEWSGAARRLPTPDLKVAAALALEEGWYDRAIFALGNSGDLRFYEWRFPVLWEQQVMAEAGKHDLDAAWILGVMRAESAMMETARSSANARGLMQVTPDTARQISKTHGLAYRNAEQLMHADTNIQFGSVYLRELMDRFDQNPVVVSAAYNAGPNAVGRWRDSRTLDEAVMWAETLSYYETRDYIPRVLAFTTIYDWRLENPVTRVSARMPGIDSGDLPALEPAPVVCRVAGHGPGVDAP